MDSGDRWTVVIKTAAATNSLAATVIDAQCLSPHFEGSSDWVTLQPASDATKCCKKGPPAVGAKELKMSEMSKRSKKRIKLAARIAWSAEELHLVNCNASICKRHCCSQSTWLQCRGKTAGEVSIASAMHS